MGHRVSLLPAQYVRPYVRRNKTDCAALLEAVRSSDIKTVPIKTQYQQMIQLSFHPMIFAMPVDLGEESIDD